MRFLAMVLLLLFSCSTGFAFQNEPDGFQGLKFNSSFEEVKSSELLCDKNYAGGKKDPNAYDFDLNLDGTYGVCLYEYYFVLDEPTQSLHGVPFDVLFTNFYKDKLYSVIVCFGQSNVRTEDDKKFFGSLYNEIAHLKNRIKNSPL